ncbi:substrate-binding domain-containing protein [Cohnella terricola]|uniref:Substrate-binding domain-containing protein n=1 Tax=Cohnella terricola TaxID=1289167 RepID=A0A559JBR9_9BACL|nr:substrate-binding domain-containing protein [Cohnella terricola]TVX97320.1 substrate-binding domain-containing protein [Cohnella terricola]
MRKIVIGAVAVAFVAAALLAYPVIFRPWPDNDKPIVFVPKTVDGRVDFWQVLGQGVYLAGKEFGEQVQTVGAFAEKDVDGQIALLEKLIGERPKAIVLAASDYNLTVPVAEKIRDSGIPLITVDSGLNGGISASFIGTDNYKAGRQAGEAMANIVDKEAEIAVISVVKGSRTSMERESGVRDRLEELGMSGVLDQPYFSESSEEKSYEITLRLLNERPDLKGIVCLNEPTTVGAAKAVMEASASGRVKMVGFDSSTAEIAFLEEGVIQAIVVQKPFNMGYLAVRAAVNVIHGKAVEPSTDTGSELITKENMYTKENQKLLFPFDGR